MVRMFKHSGLRRGVGKAGKRILWAGEGDVVGTKSGM